MIRQWNPGDRARVRPILYLPASPGRIYRQRARHTYPATVTETVHLPNGTGIRVVLDKHAELVMTDEQREMFVPPSELHRLGCECRRCTRRPASSGLDYFRPRMRRWASAAWARFENFFDY
ncbi:hypothetical protein L0U85_03880 [Glycomyces sp. L485]|uniref:hypothetical protein n=1 Tax=Glycomyces sp. L485 TaxID=2909235 RepID=UPI001F4B5FDD|nr:hypothetical protein [Glycomyces sp. L485]MCH7230002.1 hypothetical protein [Glycomyces sp. L485]